MQPLIPVMTPEPGDKVVRFVGDSIRFELKDRDGRKAKGWRALLRTNLGRGDLLREEIVRAHTAGLQLGGASWRDLPMREEQDGWSLELPLTEPGYFKAKAYLADERGWQHWPPGPDVGISIHPDSYRTGNTIYCAFARMFGKTRTLVSSRDEKLERKLEPLDKEGYTIIPPSGTLRDLARLGMRLRDGMPLTIHDEELAADAQAVNGVLYNGDTAKRNMANNVFSAINQAGGIG